MLTGLTKGSAVSWWGIAHCIFYPYMVIFVTPAFTTFTSLHSIHYTIIHTPDQFFSRHTFLDPEHIKFLTAVAEIAFDSGLVLGFDLDLGYWLPAHWDPGKEAWNRENHMLGHACKLWHSSQKKSQGQDRSIVIILSEIT